MTFQGWGHDGVEFFYMRKKVEIVCIVIQSTVVYTPMVGYLFTSLNCRNMMGLLH